MTFQVLMKSEPSFICRDCSRRFVWGQCLFFRMFVISLVSLGLIAFVCERSLLCAQQARQQDPDAEFKKLDANGDNIISADEFKAFRPSRLMHDLFKRLDRDGDGLLSLVEFRVVATMGSKARNAGRSVENEKLLTLSSLTARFISTRSANSSNASWRRSRKIRPRVESDLGTTLIAKFSLRLG